MAAADATSALEAIFRIEFPRIVAGLARSTGDVGLAEELTQDAVVDALGQWPRDGIPRNPGAWLMSVAKRRAIDRFRRDRTLAEKYALVGGLDLVEDSFGHLDEHIEDDQLRLIFVACHPVVPLLSRVALTLRVVGGLTTAEIARAYVLPEPTIAQRIVRAKKAIRGAGIPFEIPADGERVTRLRGVLEVIYLIFNEGYSATTGHAWIRPELCADAVRLARQLAVLTPEEPEVHGLLALLGIQSSRLRSRVGPNGDPVLLLDQDRRQWDRLHINLGLAALARAETLTSDLGPYALQAAIAACHARAFRAADTDWARVAALYCELASRAPSPVWN